MNQNLRRIIALLVGLAVFVFLLSILQVDISIFSQVKQWEFVFLAFAFFILELFFLALFDVSVLSEIVNKKFPLKKMFEIEFIGKFLLYLMPLRLNVPGKALAIHKILNVSKMDSISLTSFEYILTALSFFIVAFIGAVYLFQSLLQNIIYTLFILAAFILIVLFGFKLLKKFTLEKFSFVKNFFEILSNVKSSWKNIIKSKNSLKIFIIFILYWVSGIFAINFLFNAIGVNVDFLVVLVVISMAIFLGAISTIPGGIGVIDVSAVVLFQQFSVSAEAAIFVMVFYRLLLVPIIFLGYIFSLRRSLS